MKRITLLVIIIITFSLSFNTFGCGSSHKSSRGGSSTPTTPGGGGTSGGTGTGTGTGGGGNGGPTDVPFGSSSDGSGGSGSQNGATTPGGVTYNLIVPGSYSDGKPNEFLIVYSGTEGADVMTQNLQQTSFIIGSFICAVLDGVTYRDNGQAGADVIDDVRSRYNIDNDRTCLLGESAGTGAALQLGFRIRQSYFAAYWANDVNCSDTPGKTASELGFEPWGNAGPGGDWPDANTIVDGMRNAGYRLPDDAPYSGPGCDVHGSQEQLLEAIKFFPGKNRQ
ncbi:MAG: hypothetical protein E3J72_11400 [Planctomycetota bacterium]|nr:MAG: hypothetical protein E3J72_11400 [Planctomycetota bacterium]